MGFVIEDVLVRDDPAGRPAPVLFDSPHSGVCYPQDFNFTCPLSALRQAEDAYVEELFASAPESGATLLYALFPRSYIDPNRAVDDIAPSLLDDPWPEPLRPTDKSAIGMGLIRATCPPNLPLYDGRLKAAEVADRIDRYYRPYHFQVENILDNLAGRFGAVWHVNCHSMPSAGLPAGIVGRNGVDFVIGDCDGATAERGFVDFLMGRLRRMGYSVSVNNPYKGMELISRYANPACGRHAVQLEINRSLYMNEETQEKTAGFARLQDDMASLIDDICRFALSRVARYAAE